MKVLLCCHKCKEKDKIRPLYQPGFRSILRFIFVSLKGMTESLGNGRSRQGLQLEGTFLLLCRKSEDHNRKKY